MVEHRKNAQTPNQNPQRTAGADSEVVVRRPEGGSQRDRYAHRDVVVELRQSTPHAGRYLIWPTNPTAACGHHSAAGKASDHPETGVFGSVFIQRKHAGVAVGRDLPFR